MDAHKTPDAVREAILKYTQHHVGCAVYGTWVHGEPKCSCGLDKARASLAALDSRAGDAGEVQRLRKGLERARSDLHLVMLHGSVRPMWEEAKAARDRVHEVLAATPAPAVDAVPAGEVERFANDDAAKVLYDSWSDQPGWVPWVERGNSTMQERARREVSL